MYFRQSKEYAFVKDKKPIAIIENTKQNYQNQRKQLLKNIKNCHKLEQIIDAEQQKYYSHAKSNAKKLNELNAELSTKHIEKGVFEVLHMRES